MDEADQEEFSFYEELTELLQSMNDQLGDGTIEVGADNNMLMSILLKNYYNNPMSTILAQMDDEDLSVVKLMVYRRMFKNSETLIKLILNTSNRQRRSTEDLNDEDTAAALQEGSGNSKMMKFVIFKQMTKSKLKPILILKKMNGGKLKMIMLIKKVSAGEKIQTSTLAVLSVLSLSMVGLV